MTNNELLDYFLAKKESAQAQFKKAQKILKTEVYGTDVFHYHFGVMKIAAAKIEAYNDAIEAING